MDWKLNIYKTSRLIERLYQLVVSDLYTEEQVNMFDYYLLRTLLINHYYTSSSLLRNIYKIFRDQSDLRYQNFKTHVFYDTLK